jgi:hypothetical protein
MFDTLTELTCSSFSGHVWQSYTAWLTSARYSLTDGALVRID